MTFSVKPAPATVICENTFLHLVLSDTTVKAEAEVEAVNKLLLFFVLANYHVDLTMVTD